MVFHQVNALVDQSSDTAAQLTVTVGIYAGPSERDYTDGVVLRIRAHR